MGNAHEAGEGGGRHAAALVKDLAGHAETLALGDTAALADGNAGGILATLTAMLVAGRRETVFFFKKKEEKNRKNNKEEKVGGREMQNYGRTCCR